MSIAARIAQEPPFRLLSYFFVRRFAKSVRLVDRWGAVERPNYLAGVLAAADHARREGIDRISVIEFGVAGGGGLVALQEYAELVEADTGVRIDVYGFDTGEGLPESTGDYRDHPDQWRGGDYRMDVDKLQKRLQSRTKLCLGHIRDTLPAFLASNPAPVGFISCDVDLYSSTNDVLRLFGPDRKMLSRTFIYFDDIDFQFNHNYAGELLSIKEFNAANEWVKIDQWRGLKRGRPFSEQLWFDKMYIAHDLAQINGRTLAREESNGCTLGSHEVC